MKYRMYIDEVGDPGLDAAENPKHRYLSLTGVILELEYVDRVVFPALEHPKRTHFLHHADEPVILHRKELVRMKYPFNRLKDAGAGTAFNRELLALLEELDYTVMTVVIDKLEHKMRYRVWQQDAYHYSLRVLIERFVLFMKSGQPHEGDIMVESRGGKEDQRLKASYERIFREGTEYFSPADFQSHLTSSRLKVKQKSNIIAGLQLADLLAHPSYQATHARQHRQGLPENFGGKIAAILETSKYYRSPEGKIDGWGRKWLP